MQCFCGLKSLRRDSSHKEFDTRLTRPYFSDPAISPEYETALLANALGIQAWIKIICLLFFGGTWLSVFDSFYDHTIVRVSTQDLLVNSWATYFRFPSHTIDFFCKIAWSNLGGPCTVAGSMSQVLHATTSDKVKGF